MMNVVSIVPQLPPAINGVGDYALSLARQLRKDFNIHTHFIVGNSQWNGGAEIEGFSINQVRDSNSKELTNLLTNLSAGDRPSVVLLHYVGYGYAKRGCPIWLVDGLQRWKAAYSQRSLITLFHELYAFGLPWQSSFWLSPLQQNLATRLAKLSDYGWTSQYKTVGLLSKLTNDQNCPIINLPIASTIDELAEKKSWSQRQRRLIIFGTYGRRVAIYQKSFKSLLQVVRNLDIQEVLDIGKPLSLQLPEIDGTPISILGEQPVSVLSSLFQDSIAGMIDYPANLLAKSSIFANYCASGMLPIVVGTKSITEESDGLVAGKHYWFPAKPDQPLNENIAQAIADNAYDWYQNHNLSIHSQTLANMISDRYS